MHTGIVQPSGPSIHFWTSFGSVWARYTASGGAAKRLVTTTWVSPSVCNVILLIVFLQCLSQHCQPLVHCFDAGFGESTRALRAIDATHDKSCVFEHLQVLRDCRLRHLKGRG